MAIIEADSFAPGPITPAEIKAKFPNSYFEGFSPKTRNGSGEYNSLLSGNAFAWNESDELVVIPEGASFKETDTVAIHLSNPCTEFGVNIADWTSPFLLFFYSDGALIGSSEFFSDSAPFNYFSSDTPFDEVRLACSTQFGNWVIAEFAVEKAPEPELPIPTMGQWGLFLFSLITLSVSLGTVYAFRRKAATT